MSHLNEKQCELAAKLKADGFTLMVESKPEVGKRVEAVRIFQPRGFGGVILRTVRKIVPITRMAEYSYTDTLNNEAGLVESDFDGWRELQTSSEQSVPTH
ncbi:hypothetical protein ACV3HO_002428 [Pseudomonas aeruginosa]